MVRPPTNPACTIGQLVAYVENTKKVPKIKASVNDRGVKHSIEITQLTDGALSVLLPHVHVFLSLSTGMGLAVAKELELFGQTLMGHLKATWNRLVSERDEEEDPDFEDTLREFIKMACIGRHDIREKTLSYLKNEVAKSDFRDISVIAFLEHLRSMNVLADLLPGDDPILDDANMKYAFFHSMPHAWQSEWNRNNSEKDIKTDAVELEQLVRYMVTAAEISAERQAIATKRNRERQDGDNGGRTKKHKVRNGSNGTGDSSGGNNQPNGSSKKNWAAIYKARRNDPNFKGCAKHSKDGQPALHTDEECFDNPKNKAAKEAFLAKKAAQKKKKGDGNVPGESNVAELVVARSGSDDDDEDDIPIITEFDALAIEEEHEVSKWEGIRGQRAKPKKEALPPIWTMAQLKARRSDLEAWTKEVLMEQGADEDEAMEIYNELKNVRNSIPKLLSGWCYHWVVPPHKVEARYHIYKKFDVEEFGKSEPTKVAKDNKDEITNTHFFDCFVSDIQKCKESKQRLPMQELKQRLEPLLEAFFEDGEDYEPILQCDSEIASNKNYSSVVDDSIDVDCMLAPLTIIVIHKIQDRVFDRPLLALCDSGADTTMIQKRSLPSDISLTVSKRRFNGVGGSAELTHEVQLEGMYLPELSPSRRIDYSTRCTVIDTASRFDVLLGRDFLMSIGIDIIHSERQIQWMDSIAPFRKRDIPIDEQNLYETCLEIFVGETVPRVITEAKYEAVNTDEIAQAQLHLTPSQRNDLAIVLREFPTLFDGQLRVFPGKKVHLELVDGARPVHKRPYSIPHVHLAVFKKELERMCQIGVIEPCGPSEWAAPTFLIPKKDGSVRWVSDFRGLNQLIRRKVYRLPIISEIIRKRFGYKFFSKLDASMMFYTFELDEASKDLCVIVTPFGNYRYNRLPMGVSQSPDVAQAMMEDITRALDDVEVYMDDLGLFSQSWDEHLAGLRRLLTVLRTHGFAINARKSEWGVQETDWLGHWLTPEGIKPCRKKIEAILKLDRPTTLKQLRSFIGSVNFYRDMFRRRSHILAPLTELTKSKSRVLQWTPECEKAFTEMKAIMAKDVLVRYPDHNQPFHIYTDASDYQLGAVILQNNAPVAFYSRKLSQAQRNYTTMEKELLSIVETLKEFRSMLYGCQELHIYTDHKNLTYENLNTQRVIRWRLYVEEFNPRFHYVKGEDNTLADALSRIPRIKGQTADDDAEKSDHHARDLDASDTEQGHEEYAGSYSSVLDDDVICDCLLSFPDPPEELPYGKKPCPVDYNRLAEEQATDTKLNKLLKVEPHVYKKITMGDNTSLICRINKTAKMGANWQICIPDQSLDHLINWYHTVLNHTGMTRLHDTIACHFYHSNMRTRVSELLSKCDACQRHKLPGKPYGELPPREAEVSPWRVIALDLIGPWKVKVQGKFIEIKALTIIDTVTNYPEIVRIKDKSSKHICTLFENAWLSRYPKPMYAIYDQGTEFKSYEFQQFLSKYGIYSRRSTIKNPQSNGIVERMHQTMGNILRTLFNIHPPANEADVDQLIDSALQTVAYTTRATIHSTMGISPGALVFNRDMILDIPIQADLHMLQEKRQILIDQRLINANRRRISHDYQVGEKVLKIITPTEAKQKLDPRAIGPFTITRVHINGTVTLQIGRHTTERINVRRIKPYRS